MVELRKATPFDYVRFVLSALLLLFSMVVTFYAIWETKTNFWHQVPGYAALLLFFFDLFILGIVEGLQIALVELKRQHPDSYKVTHPRAYNLGLLAAKGDNVERFLMGRQVFVVVLVFFAAKLTTIYLEDGESFLFPAPFWFRAAFLETGILSCLVVVIIAQLLPQIVAAKYPVHFLQFLIMRPAYWACVGLEATGLTHICWVLAAGMERLAGMEDDKTTINPNDLQLLETEPNRVPSNGGTDSDSACVDMGVTGFGFDNKAVTTTKSDLEEKYKMEDLQAAQFSRFSDLVNTLNRSIDPDTLAVLRHYLDTHPEKFQQFPSVVGNKLYPAPQAIAQQISDEGHDVPKFLTAISDPEHIPPHIVACELLAQNRQLREEVRHLEAKLTTSKLA